MKKAKKYIAAPRLVYAVVLCVMAAVLCTPFSAHAASEPGGVFDIKKTVLERFLRYVVIDTESDLDSGTTPSSSKQLVLAKLLYEECKAIGLSEVELSEYGIVTATLPANVEYDAPVIGFLSHIDTSPEFSGKDVKPRIIENYDGNDIVLNEQTTLSPKEFPFLKNYIGQTIITAGGDTLLGADDKAGIAEILTAMEYLIRHPEIPRGKIRIAFNPDEEIGEGTNHFDVKAFGADFAFTVDGSGLGEFEHENFNAAAATLEISGTSERSSVFIAMEMMSRFPPDQTPAKTEGYEGFFHLTRIEGDAAKTKMDIIIRCFDKEKIGARKKFVEDLAGEFNKKYGQNTVKLAMKDQYFNMKEMIAPHIIEYAKAAYSAAGVKVNVVPVRGGTDGAMLSYKGLPCPNVFTGGHNFHGPYEFIPLESMEKAVHVIVNLARASDEPKRERFTASFEITGKSVHPGYAKGIMKNAALIASEIASAVADKGLPHLMEKIDGGVAKAEMHISIGYSNPEERKEREEFVKSLTAKFNEIYGENTVRLIDMM